MSRSLLRDFIELTLHADQAKQAGSLLQKDFSVRLFSSDFTGTKKGQFLIFYDFKTSFQYTSLQMNALTFKELLVQIVLDGLGGYFFY